MDCKATVNIGDYSRGGRTRGDNQALDHAMGCEEKYPPFGVVDEDSGQLPLAFGRSAKTRDFIMDCLYGWWERLPLEERNDCSRLQIKVDNGPESSGRRTQFLKRRVEFTDYIGKPIQLLFSPPPLSQQIQSGGAMLGYRSMGHSGKALEWRQVSGCGHDARMGQEHDLEGPSSGGGTQPQGVRERRLPL
jgi:hypothetical protein